MDIRKTLVEVFGDTVEFYETNETLRKNVEEIKKNTRFYAENEYPYVEESVKEGRVSVSKSRSFEAAIRLHQKYPDKKIAVHNFASAKNPGGGVRTGSRAQEECLCRCSTLYPALTTDYLSDKYYNMHRTEKNTPVYTDSVIYTPNVLICKTDDDIPKRLDEADFVPVDIITCAAPNVRWANDIGKKITDKELFDIHVKRAGHIMNIAAANGVDILVLGAFGCGAFKNPADVVAKAYNKVLDEYKTSFDLIEFAIFCTPKETANFEYFNRYIKQS